MNGPNRKDSSQGGRPRPAPNSHNRPPQKQQGGDQQRPSGQGSGPAREGGGGGGQNREGGSRRRKRRRGGGGGGGGGQQNQPNQTGGQTSSGQGGNQARQGGGPRHGDGGRPQKQGKGSGRSGRGGQKEPRKESKPIRLMPEFKEVPNNHIIKRYGVMFYENIQAAKAELDKIKSQSEDFDQLNVVVKAEANMDDPDFNQMENVKLFAGAAWTTIHERRKEEGWYDAPR